MKKLLSILLAAAVLLSMAVGFTVSASAATSGKCGDNVSWSYSNGTLTISGTGAMYDYGSQSDNFSPWVEHKDDIKKIVVKSGVTSIGAYAFYCEKGPTSAQLPSTLTVIGGHAFQSCSNLTTINFPKSITTINARAFSGCNALTSVSFPEDSQLTKLGEMAFASCANLQSAYLPNSLTTISNSVLRYNPALTYVHIPENLKTIPRFFVQQASSLTSVTIPDSVTKISEKAFNGCSKLSEVIMPDSVNIDANAFSNSAVALKISAEPQNVNASGVGDTATVRVEATGEALKYDWYYRNKGVTEWTKSSIHTAEYSTQLTSARYGRQVYCMVSDRYNTQTKTRTATLKFDTFQIEDIITDINVAHVGDTATIRIIAKAKGLTYKWRYRNATGEWTESTIKSSTYSTPVTSARYGRRVQCLITSKEGTTYSTPVYTLKFDTGLRITQQPVDTAVAFGETAKLKVAAEGTGKTYTWYYKNSIATYFTKSTCTSSTYSTAMTAARDGRQVYCVVTDKYGVNVKSDIVTLTIKK